MSKRRLVQLIRKYTIILFLILLVIIYFNHKLSQQVEEIPLEQFPNAITQDTDQDEFEATANYRDTQPLMEPAYIDPLQINERMRKRIFGDDQSTTSTQQDIETSTRPAARLEKYFVYSEKCKMPYADPFSPQLLKIYKPAKFKKCANDSDLMTLRYDALQQAYQLHVNELVVPTLQMNISEYRCNYREVTRPDNSSAEKHSDIHPRVYITQDVSLPRNASGVIVECHDAKNAATILQQDAFPLVQAEQPKVPRPVELPKLSDLERKPSVIMLGLDSMSRINFRRTMPKTVKFVSQQGWFEMEGYNKVADNTWPNLITVLTGHKSEQAEQICYTSFRNCIDRLPWIWRDYKRAGYVTALAEDISVTGLFTLGRQGFGKVPVDHYLRTLLLGLDSAMKSYLRFGYKYCRGRRLSIAYVYEFCNQFVERYMLEQDQPVFGFFWSCTFTHDFYFGAASLDDKYVEFLHKLEQLKLFENSIVVLFSDHGSRFGELMEISDNFLEERLPMLHIYLPEWFRRTYPKLAHALYLNRNRLSSNYDLYNTLKHILQLNENVPTELPTLKTCATSQSLLHVLPQERSCEDACIVEHYCTCNQFATVSCSGYMYVLAKQVIYQINRYLIENQYNKICQRLHLEELDHCELSVVGEEDGKPSVYGSKKAVRIKFHTHPEVGVFQMTSTVDKDMSNMGNLHDISRLNSYHNNSKCINDTKAKKFCFCFEPSSIGNEEYKHWRRLRLKNQTNKEAN